MLADHRKVLIADDDPAMLRLLGKWLETAGYQVQRAGDGRQARAAIERDCPHIIITDWEMPHLDGLDLCRWLREQSLPHYVYAVFLTARSGLEDIIKGLEAGANDFLKKPVDRGELLARLHAGVRMVDMERRLSQLARSDSLTGLATQRALFDHLQHEWKRVERHRLPLSCVMLDIDFFKRINDTHGHPVGDMVIRRVAEVLAANTRGSDLVSRYGGEEFCMVLPETDESQAVKWAERVRQRIAACSIVVGEKELRVTASFGVAARLADTRSPEELVDLSDQALLVAKRSGRDRVVSFQSLNETGLGDQTADDLEQTLAKLPARQVMTTIVAGLHQDDEIGNAARYFLRFRISSAPVVDDAGQLVGILSERDLMAPGLWAQWSSLRIQDVMQRNVVCYDEETPVALIYDFLGRVSIHSVVIVHEGRPMGIISRASLLRWFTNMRLIGMPADGAEATEQEYMTDAHPAVSREGIGQTAHALLQEASDLASRLKTGDPDVVACVVVGASRIQELTNDLLASARYADNGTDKTAHAQRSATSAAAADLVPAGTTHSFGGPTEPHCRTAIHQFSAVP